jgi:four helix bundle protein
MENDMATARKFEELDCWNEARMLVKLAFKASESERLSSDTGTSDQFRRAALSVMNNIAEGHGRLSTKEFIRFLDIAQSSAMEVKSITYVLEDLNYLPSDQTNAIRTKSDHTMKLIRGLIRYLHTCSPPPSRH